MSLIKRVLSTLSERRDKVLSGNINSIPSPFKRFSNDFIGVEQGRLYLITSYTKVGKTQFSSYLFLYNTILYAYRHPDQIRVKIFYYPLEETPEQVTCRFISFLLYYLSRGKIIKSPVDLMSSKNIAIEQEVLDILETEEYTNILDFFEKSVLFSDSTNASGVWFECQRYAQEHGKVFYDQTTYKDEFGKEQHGKKFNHYESDDPDEYRIIFYDHLALTSPERGMDLRQTMAKLSEYFVLLRNRYNFSAVIIQQQAITDNLEAFKSQKLRPTIANLGDAKTVARDIDVCIGLFSPYRYELTKYPQTPDGYDITKFKDNIRFAEILLNRHGQSNGMIALLFIGQCNYWQELPLSKETVKIQEIYKFLDIINNRVSKSFFSYSLRNLLRRFHNTNNLINFTK